MTVPGDDGVGGPQGTQERAPGPTDSVRAERPAAIGLDRLSLNQATVKHLGLKEAVALCARHDIPAIGLWRDRVAETGLAEAAWCPASGTSAWPGA